MNIEYISRYASNFTSRHKRNPYHERNCIYKLSSLSELSPQYGCGYCSKIPWKSERLIISAPSSMCSRAKTTLVYAPLILRLAFADRFLNVWNLDSLTAQIAMVSCSALTLGLAAWLKEYGILFPVENGIWKWDWDLLFELSEAMRSTCFWKGEGRSCISTVWGWTLYPLVLILWLQKMDHKVYPVY